MNIEAQSQTIEQTDGNAQPQEVNPGAIRKATTQSILKAAGNALGTEIDSMEGLMAALARLSAQQSTMVTKQPEVDQPASKRTTTSDLQEQFQALRQELSKKDQALRERELDSEIRSAMGDRFDSDLVDYALTKVRGNIQWNEDGTYQIVNNRGQVRYGNDGTPLSIQGLVAEVAQNNPKLLKQSASSSGSGLRVGGNIQYGGGPESIPSYADDPAAFKAWAQRNGLGKGSGLKSVTASATNSTNSRKLF